MLEDVQGLLHKKAMTYTDDPDMWDDLVQQANIAILACIDEYDPEKGKFTTFACAVAKWPMFNYSRLSRNVVTRKDRRVSPRHHIELTELEERKYFSTYDKNVLEEEEEIELLREAMLRLDRTKRQVIAWLLEGYSQADISRIMGVTQSAISLWKMQAFSVIREYLETKC